MVLAHALNREAEVGGYLSFRSARAAQRKPCLKTRQNKSKKEREGPGVGSGKPQPRETCFGALPCVLISYAVLLLGLMVLCQNVV